MIGDGETFEMHLFAFWEIQIIYICFSSDLVSVFSAVETLESHVLVINYQPPEKDEKFAVISSHSVCCLFTVLIASVLYPASQFLYTPMPLIHELLFSHLNYLVDPQSEHF